MFIKNGKVTAETKGCAVGASSWSDLGQLLPALFAPDAKPPVDEEEAGALGKAGHFIAEHGGEVASLAQVFMRRIFASNFVAEAALPEERAELEKAEIPVKSPMAQNYAAWRRAMLWFSGIALALAALLGFIVEVSDAFRPIMPPAVRNLWVGIQLVNFASPVLVIVAALKWMNMRRSRRRARWGWLLQFFGPLFLLLLPIRHLTSNEDLARAGVAELYEQELKTRTEQIERALPTEKAELEKELADWKKRFREKDEPEAIKNVLANENLPQLEQARKMIAIVMGGFVIITLAPRVFGLFPGIVRASLTLRTLVPESPVPGYVVALIEPLFMVFILVLVVIAAQVGNALTFFGLLGMLASTFMLLREVGTLCKPMSAEAMNAHIKPLRQRLVIVGGVGILLVIVGLHDLWKEVGAWKIAAAVGHLIGNIFLLTAVASDFFIGLMKFSFDQEKQMRTSPLFDDMEKRFADLAQVRMTQITDDEPAAPPPTIPPAGA
jgi:hypothetical protein